MTHGPGDERAMVRPERIERSFGGHITGDLGFVENITTIVGDRELERPADGSLGPDDHPGAQELTQQTTDRLRREMDPPSHVRPARPRATGEQAERQELTRRQPGAVASSVQAALDEASELDEDEGQRFDIRAGPGSSGGPDETVPRQGVPHIAHEHTVLDLQAADTRLVIA
jgi:hypothetical protein